MQGLKCCLAQHNILEGNAKEATEYRKEILVEMKKHVQVKKEINDIIIAGDFNQSIDSNKV